VITRPHLGVVRGDGIGRDVLFGPRLVGIARIRSLTLGTEVRTREGQQWRTQIGSTGQTIRVHGRQFAVDAIYA